MSNTLQLYYWRRNTPSGSIFSVEIAAEETVEKLRRTICERLQIQEATTQVYKVEPQTRVEHEVAEFIDGLTFKILGRSLRNTQKLSAVFPNGPQGYLHIVIDDEICKFHLWQRGAAVNQLIAIPFPSTETPADLVNRLLEIESSIAVSPAQVELYLLNHDDDLAEALDDSSYGTPLLKSTSLREHLLDVPFTFTPRIVFQVNTVSVVTHPPRSARRYAHAEYPIQAERQAFLDKSPAASPSAGGEPQSFHARQCTTDKYIPCGRPRTPEETIPVTLLHPVFGQFLEDCQTLQPTREDHTFVQKFATAMANLYDSEKTRTQTIFHVLEDYDIHLVLRNIDKIAERTNEQSDYRMDGSISTEGYDYVIVEFKNEAGNTRSEPYYQAALYYLESTRKRAPEMIDQPLPCLLLVLFGPYVVFAGAAWNLRPVVQLLSAPLALHYHSTDTQNQLTVTRHMAAFRKAVQSLKVYYEGLPKPSRSRARALPHLFPHPAEFTSLNDPDTKIQFAYTKQFKEADKTKADKLLFFGTIKNTNESICIKFVRRYSREAHECCATLGFAPPLRGFETIPGGWFMVVMDALPETGYTSLYYTARSVDRAVVVEQLSGRLRNFHEKDFVHGDIRDTNIMVSNDGQKFMIVDFDWAGKKGQVRYPPYVNRTNIWRPNGAWDEELIQAEHDIAMLDNILQCQTPDPSDGSQ